MYDSFTVVRVGHTTRRQAFASKCYRRSLGISRQDLKMNEIVHWKVMTGVGSQGKLIGAVRRRKAMWFGCITRQKKKRQAKMGLGDSRGRQKTRETGEALGRQPETVDQTGQPNPDQWDKWSVGQTTWNSGPDWTAQPWRVRQVKRWADNLKQWTRLDSPTLTRETGEALGRQPETVDQTGQPNPDPWDKWSVGQTTWNSGPDWTAQPWRDGQMTDLSGVYSLYYHYPDLIW